MKRGGTTGEERGGGRGRHGRRGGGEAEEVQVRKENPFIKYGLITNEL